MKNLPALKTALWMAAGIIGGRFLQLPIPPLFITCVIAAIFTAVIFFKNSSSPLTQVMIAILLVMFGSLNYSLCCKRIPSDNIKFFNGKEAEISCYLLDQPQKKANSIKLLVSADTITVKNRRYKISGRIIMYLKDKQNSGLTCGDEIKIRGRLKAPPPRRNPGGFDYRSYLAARNIHSIFYADKNMPLRKTGRKRGNFFKRNIIIPVRQSMIKAFSQSGGPASKELLAALIIGNKEFITDELRQNFSNAGVVHVLAVSGLHVGFILLIFNGLGMLVRLNRTGRIIFTIIGLIFYVILTGAGPPVVRAALMGGFYLSGQLLERKSSPFNLIGAAALILLLFNPGRLFDTGFQLSFSAVIAILYIYPRLSALEIFQPVLLKNRLGKPGKYILSGLLVSFSAQIGTLPFTAFYFQKLPLLALFINLLAIPLTGLITALGFTTYISFLISSSLGCIYGGLNRVIIAVLTKLVSTTANLSFSYINIAAPALIESLIFFIIVVLLLNLSEKKLLKPLFISLLILLNIHVWTGAIKAEERQLRYLQFDVGQGDAALLRLPHSKTILVDGGDKTPSFDNGSRVILPYLRRKGIKKLDLLIATHPHNDHIGGLLEIINNVKVDQIVTSSAFLPTKLYRNFLQTAVKLGIPLTTISHCDTLEFPGIQILLTQVFHFTPDDGKSPDPNNESVVMKLIYGHTALLFMGDAEKEAERQLLKNHFPVNCDLLKAGHHGSKTSSSLAFLKTVRPEIAVVSVGERNRYKHPSIAVMNRYKNLEIYTLRTDQQQALLFSSDGNRIKQVSWK